MKKLYLIDFDGTITSKDSFILFTFFSRPFYLWLIYWISTCGLFFFISKGKLKERFFRDFKGVDLFLFQFICNQFVKLKLNKIIKESFKDYVSTIDSNSEIVIVSASISNYLKPWSESMGFKLISTELEVISEKLTGKFLTKNCNGQEKVIRILENYDLTKYKEIHVFGNSDGDLQMLELGTHKYFNFFN